MGGHVSQIQSSKNAGDELFFERQYYMIKFKFYIFSHGKETEKRISTKSRPTIQDLPDFGAAVVDTNDTALYLYIANPNTEDPEEKKDVENATAWMTDNIKENRDITIFYKGTIPPNLLIIFSD